MKESVIGGLGLVGISTLAIAGAAWVESNRQNPEPQSAFGENNGLMVDFNCFPEGLGLGFVGPINDKYKEYRVDSEDRPNLRPVLMHIDTPDDPMGGTFYGRVESLDGIVVELKGGHRYRITMNEYPSGIPAASVVLRAPHCKK